MRKIAANYLFPISGEPIKNGVVCLNQHNEIVSVEQLNGREEESVEFYNGILCPGFVNAHCHLELSYLAEAIPQHTGLVGFIEHISKINSPSNIDEHLLAAFKADSKMHREGVVAIADISNTDKTFDLKAGSPILYHSFIEVFGSDPSVSTANFNAGASLVAKAKLRGLRASLTPHAPYSMSDELFELVVTEALKYGILSIHNQESREESELFTNATGAFVQYYRKQNIPLPTAINKASVHRLLNTLGKQQLSLLLIHNIYSSQQDIEDVMGQNPSTSWVICPNSNLYIEGKLPPVELLRKNKLNIAIGTDSLASNTQLSMVEELKTLNSQLPDILLNELLEWATLGGAKAIKTESNLGTFEPGKSPGVVLIDHVDFSSMKLTEASKSSLLVPAGTMKS